MVRRVVLAILALGCYAHDPGPPLTTKNNNLHQPSRPATPSVKGPARDFNVELKIYNASSLAADDKDCDWQKLTADAGNGASSHVYILNFRDYRAGYAEDAMKIQCRSYPIQDGQVIQMELIGPTVKAPTHSCAMWWRGPGPANDNMATVVLIAGPDGKLPDASSVICSARIKNT